MNKNLSNQKGNENPGGLMQSQGNQEKGRHREGRDDNMKRGNETHREKPLADQNGHREKEAHQMVSWNREHTGRECEIHPVNPQDDSSPFSENEIHEIKSQTAKNKDTVNGYGSQQRNPMYNQESDYKFSTDDNQGWESQLNEVKKTPLLGAALYPVAAVLLVGWVIGFFIYDAGDTIHILLVLALISVLIKVALGRSD